MKRTSFNRRPYTGRQSPARDAASAKAYTFLRVAVHQREGGLCVACGVHESLEEGNCHHRQLRSRGGRDDAWNCIWLCSGCHGDIHANPAKSTETGYLCPSWEDPAKWPLKCANGWFQPSPDGWATADHLREVEAL